MESLPLEIKKTISNFVDIKTKRQLRLANSKWFKIIDYRNFTLYLTKTAEWKQIVDRFEQYQAPIALELKMNVIKTPVDILEHLTRLTNLEVFKSWVTLRIKDEDVPKLAASLPNLRHFPSLVLCNTKLWKLFPKLERLNPNTSFNVSMADLADVLSGMHNLQKLSFCLQETANPIAAIANASKLTSLRVEISDVPPWTDIELQRLSNLRKFTFKLSANPPKEKTPILSLKYMTALESLESDLQIRLDGGNASRLTKLRVSTLTPLEQQQMPLLSNLERIEYVSVDGHMDYLTALTRLTELSLASDFQEGPKYSVLGNIRSSRFTKLTAFHLQEILDFGYLTQLDLLQFLHLEGILSYENISAKREFLKYVTALTALQNLSLHTCYHDDDLLTLTTSFMQLTHLSIGHKNTDVDSLHLTRLTRLKFLSWSALTSTEVVAIKQALPDLVDFYFSEVGTAGFVNLTYKKAQKVQN